MEREEVSAWLRLLETPLVGREAARKLLAEFGSPDAALGASVAARRQVVPAEAAKSLDTVPEHLATLVETTWQWLHGAADGSAGQRQLLTPGDAHYPQLLLQTVDPPLLLYAQGDVSLLNAPSIGVVGSRHPTPQGKENARAFAAELSQAGWTVVSGLAAGIDGAAHEGALAGQGRTVAVVGTGLDRVYPRRHLELAHKIAQYGTIISEYSIGTPPLPPHFPQRNRIIAGITRGTLVIEAALQSGSLITARLAIEAGREVFAIPGSIHSPQSRGCHALLKQGAKLVESAAEVIEEFPGQTRLLPRNTTAPQNSEPPTEDPLLDAMGYDPVSLDSLTARTGWSAPALNARLLELEMAGDVSRLPGQLFQRMGTS